MAMVLISPPAAQPLSVAQAKEFLKIENTDDDVLIGDLIIQALTHIQNLIGHKLITQTWRLFFDELPADNTLALSLAPAINIVEIRYFDAQGVATIVPPEDYEYDTYTTPARLKFADAICSSQQLNGIEVDLQVGYGASSVDVPGDILRALMLTVAHWYEFRAAVRPADQPLSNPTGLNHLLAPYKRVGL